LVGNIGAGRVKALVQTGAERWPEPPDVPTMQEAGISELRGRDMADAARA
jgi:tripartite-type tricarboxylate transporter receptor subunit TctC